MKSSLINEGFTSIHIFVESVCCDILYKFIHCTAKIFHGNRVIFFVNCGHFKQDDVIHTILNTKLGSLALESGQNTLSEKATITIIVDDAMHFDIKLMNGR